jgi:2-polyprenyl-6-methoxyphenol hydroxylase-like FAD-dependent oxidoreductase
MARAGIDVQVYEQAQLLTEVGAGVSLAPNGLRMLERLAVGGCQAGGCPVRLVSAAALRRADGAARALSVRQLCGMITTKGTPHTDRETSRTPGQSSL